MKCRHKTKWLFKPWTLRDVSALLEVKAGNGKCSSTEIEWCRTCGAIRFPVKAGVRWLSPERSFPTRKV